MVVRCGRRDSSKAKEKESEWLSPPRNNKVGRGDGSGSKAITLQVSQRN